MHITAAIVALLTVCGCSSLNQSAKGETPTNGGVSGEIACASTYSPLPAWAQAGFTPPDQSVKQVRGVDGSILGVVFGDSSSPSTAPGLSQKILWVASPIPGPAPSTMDKDLMIHGTLNGSDTAIDRVISGGPGPSVVDVPTAGCWTFSLSWSGRTDRLALRYR